jgi:hypothetical protein
MSKKEKQTNEVIQCLLLPVLVGSGCGAILEHSIDLHRHHVVLTTQHGPAFSSEINFMDVGGLL